MPVAERIASNSIAESMLAEIETQAPITRSFLERLPEDKLTWKPHPRSLTAGQLALHLATVPAGVAQLVQNSPTVAREAFVFPQPASRDEILRTLDESVAKVRTLLPRYGDDAMQETWRLVDGSGQELMAPPRGAFLRDVMLSHWYQHRGQFSVYLRLLDIPVPASWGPSGDEPPLFMQAAQPR
ncbi:MAG: DinB family protein [Acidobacteriaceae bacterium]